MPANSPYEILSGPLEMYFAPYGTTMPLVSAAPAVAWKLIGTSGSKNYDEDGVTVRPTQTIETDAFRMLGGTGPRKAARTSEDLEIEVTIHDMSVQQFAYAMNGFAHTMTTTVAASSIPGSKSIPLQRGVTVGQVAVLLRGTNQSPEATLPTDSYNAQYWVPNAVIAGEPEQVWSKAGPVGFLVQIRAIEDATDGFGKFIAQNAAALP